MSFLHFPPLSTLASSSKSNSSLSTLDDYIQHVLRRLEIDDPTLTKLQIDDFSYPNVDYLNTESYKDYFNSESICTLLDTCCKYPNHVKDIEFRFVDRIDQYIVSSLVNLLQKKKGNYGTLDCPPKAWGSLSIIGCSTRNRSIANDTDQEQQEPSYAITYNYEREQTRAHSRRHATNPDDDSSSSSYSESSSDDDVEADVSDLLVALSKSLCHIKRLVLNHNNLRYAGFHALGSMLRSNSCNTLTTLHMKRESLRGHNAVALFEGLSHNTTIKELVFNFVKFDAIGIEAFAACMKYHVQRRRKLGDANTDDYDDECCCDGLQLLDLGACYLSDAHVATIVSSLIGYKSLKALVLTLNSCHREGSKALNRLLRHEDCSLEVLDLSHQKPPPISPVPAETAVQMIEAAEELITGNAAVAGGVARNNTTVTGHHNGGRSRNWSLNKVQVPILADALRSNSSLKVLQLSRNRLLFEDVLPLWNVLTTHNKTLDVLDLNNNSIFYEQCNVGGGKRRARNNMTAIFAGVDAAVEAAAAGAAADISSYITFDDDHIDAKTTASRGLYYVANYVIPNLLHLKQLHLFNNDIALERRYIVSPTSDTSLVDDTFSKAKSCSISQALHQLTNAMAQNVTLHRLDMKTRYLLKHPIWIYYCILNRGGRYLLSSDQEKVPLGLWSYVLGHIASNMIWTHSDNGAKAKTRSGRVMQQEKKKKKKCITHKTTIDYDNESFESYYRLLNKGRDVVASSTPPTEDGNGNDTNDSTKSSSTKVNYTATVLFHLLRESQVLFVNNK